ncbi:MAG: UvrB/UvrC motif-containing protein [bacterium]
MMEKFKYLKKDKINKLPKTTGVYAFSDGKQILYIGKAVNIRNRVKNHLKQPTYRDNLFINQVKKIGFIRTCPELTELSTHLTSHPASHGSEIEALILEANLIKKHQPKYNVVWRDDKNYFYIGVTKESFPRVFITHQIQNTRYKIQNTKYIGPFIDGSSLKQTLKVLRKAFPYRTCKTLPKHSCLWHQLERCPAPCLMKSEMEKARLKNECQRNIKNLALILQGKRKQALTGLKKEMKLASHSQNFERAGKIRDQITSLEKVISHSRIFEPAEVKSQQDILQKILNIKKPIERIESYDVSNIQGKEATGAMVVFVEGKPDKRFYRKFKIRLPEKPNDVAMIKEVLSRRLKHKEWPYPDLILIDGGIGQLNAALKIKMQNAKCKKIKVISLAKKENKLFIENRKKPLLLKTLPREVFNLILQLRDEAHRFAIAYHRKLRGKVLLK